MFGSLAGCNGPESSAAPSSQPAPSETTEVQLTTASGDVPNSPTEPRESSVAPTDSPDPSNSTPAVTGLTVEPDSIKQGETVTVRLSLENGTDRPVVRPVRLSEDEVEFRRKRLAIEPGEAITTSVDIQLDRVGTRTLRTGEHRTSFEVSPWPPSVVETAGTAFVLDGERFPMFGTNNAYLSHKTPKTVDEVFHDAASLGLNTVRVMLNGGGQEVGYCREFACGRSQFSLQPGPREYDEASFRKLDYAIAAAKRYGLRLVISLITLGPGGISAYLDWVDDAETRDDFFTNERCRAIYRDYLETVLTRENTFTGVEYRNDPTVAIWELANEPELETGDPYGVPLQDWIAEMADHVTGLEATQLVSVGLIGWNSRSNEADYLACFEPEAVDAASTHLYYDAAGVDDWIERHATGVHEELGKPFYVGEFGWDATRSEDDYERQLQNRHEGFRDWFDQFRSADIAGSLFWFLLGHLDDGARFPDHDGFGVYAPEDEETAAIIEDYAERVGAAEVRGR